MATINLAVPTARQQLSTQRGSDELLKMHENRHYPIYRVRYNSLYRRRHSVLAPL